MFINLFPYKVSHHSSKYIYIYILLYFCTFYLSIWQLELWLSEWLVLSLIMASPSPIITLKSVLGGVKGFIQGLQICVWHRRWTLFSQVTLLKLPVVLVALDVCQLSWRLFACSWNPQQSMYIFPCLSLLKFSLQVVQLVGTDVDTV